MGNTALRGFDLGRLRLAVEALTMASLCEVLDSGKGPVVGTEEELVDRIVRQIGAGRVSVSSALESLHKDELRRACVSLGVDDEGKMDELTARIERATRYKPISAGGSALELTLRRIGPRIDRTLTARERLLVAELHTKLAGRDEPRSFALGELIGRLGRDGAEDQARCSPAQELGVVFWRNGLETAPDLALTVYPPPVDAEIAVQLRMGWDLHDDFNVDDVDDDWTPRLHAPSDVVERRVHVAFEYSVAGSIAELGVMVSNSAEAIQKLALEKIPARAADDTGVSSTRERAKLRELVEGLHRTRIDIVVAVERIVQRLDVDHRSEVLQHLFDIAMVDGRVVPEAEAVLRWIAHALRPRPGLFERLMLHPTVGSVRPSSEEPQERSAAASRVLDETGEASMPDLTVDGPKRE